MAATDGVVVCVVFLFVCLVFYSMLYIEIKRLYSILLFSLHEMYSVCFQFMSISSNDDSYMRLWNCNC